MRKKLTLTGLLLLALTILLSACGSGGQTELSKPDEAVGNSVTPQRKAATAEQFRDAIKNLGYMEESDFYDEFGDILYREGSDSQAILDAMAAKGIAGFMNSEEDSSFEGSLQEVYYDLYSPHEDIGENEYWESFGSVVGFFAFLDEDSAISAVEELKSEFDLTNTPGITEEHYSSVTAQSKDDIVKIVRIDNTFIAFVGAKDCAGCRVFDVLGY